MTYRLSIGGKYVGDMQTLEGCWASIDAAYGQFEDRYAGGLRFRITDKTTGRSVREAMVGGIWDACCKDMRAFQMYLSIGDWHYAPAVGPLNRRGKHRVHHAVRWMPDKQRIDMSRAN
ncbi:hypothetical protein [Cupriavidus sp. 8B]